MSRPLFGVRAQVEAAVEGGAQAEVEVEVAPPPEFVKVDEKLEVRAPLCACQGCGKNHTGCKGSRGRSALRPTQL